MDRNKLYEDDVIKISNLDLPWDELKNKSVLITGATGLIGTVIVDVLMYRNICFNDNIVVLAVSRNLEEAQKRFGKYFLYERFRFIRHDINKEFDNIEKADYIIHCASNTHPVAYSTKPIETILTCVNGTKNVLDYAVKCNIQRSIFLSSVEIYGENKENIAAFSEEDFGYINCNTLRSGYPEGKRLGEALCNAYIKEHGLNINIARLCRVFGPTVRKDDSKALSQFLRNAIEKKDIVLKSNGLQEYSYLYVVDAVAAIFTIFFKGNSGEAYNVCDESCDISLRNLANLIANFSGQKVIFDVPNTVEQAGFSVVTRAIMNSNKLKNLGFKAFYNIKDGIELTLKILK